MSRRLTVALALATSMLLGCEGSQIPENSGVSDLNIAKSLVGAWAGEEGGGGKVKAVTQYKSDGTFEDTAGGKASASGTWKVEEGTLFETVEKGGQSRSAKRGQVRKATVVSIDDKELKYKTEKGEEGVRSRVP